MGDILRNILCDGEVEIATINVLPSYKMIVNNDYRQKMALSLTNLGIIIYSMKVLYIKRYMLDEIEDVDYRTMSSNFHIKLKNKAKLTFGINFWNRTTVNTLKYTIIPYIRDFIVGNFSEKDLNEYVVLKKRTKDRINILDDGTMLVNQSCIVAASSQNQILGEERQNQDGEIKISETPHKNQGCSLGCIIVIIVTILIVIIGSIFGPTTQERNAIMRDRRVQERKQQEAERDARGIQKMLDDAELLRQRGR